MESMLAQREPDPWLDRLHLDESSKLQIRLFIFHISIITLFALPSLALHGGKAAPFFAQLTSMFSFTSLVLALLGLRAKRPLSSTSFGVWDEVLALNALSFLCSGMARLMIYGL